MKVVAIIQARMGSSRLPGKVLLDLAGEPMLSRVVRRLRRARRIHEVVVATTTESRDDALETFCREHGFACFRGDENDVLDRYYRAAQAHGAGMVVRITSDCPFIEPEIVDRVVTEGDAPDVDYASNIGVPRTFPRGLDTEVMPWRTLDRVWQEDRNPAWREHVTQYIHKRPELFRTRNVCHDTDLSHLRWTVDTPEDFAFASQVYEHFGHDDFSWRDVLDVLDRHPAWSEINQAIEQKVV
ncbi:MAG: glycosyltransferase family protein [Chthoniobacter sp.]|nr:glycosyltransferase family protein [Chthoniobacter sp.]